MSSAGDISGAAACVSRSRLAGWGRTKWADCELWRPSSLSELDSVLGKVGTCGVIGRGCGRSYGDVSINHKGRVIDMRAMNSIELFDVDTRLIVCEAGVTMNQVVARYLAEGFVPPVCPGTGYVTIGGAVAHDVHGKNHDRLGSFGDHVEWLDLLLPSGEIRRVSLEQHPELLQATIGGAGLTGLIIRVAFRMLHIGTNAVKLYEQRMDGLDRFMEALQLAGMKSTYSVGWIDALARGSRLGRGILITAEPADSFLPLRKRRSINVPFDLPPGMMNRLTVNIFNNCYFRRFGRERIRYVDFGRFVFPLDALLHWNRLYGSRGVFQFQCVIPHDRAPTAIRELLMLSAASGAASPLAVLKTLGGKGRGYLSFPMSGFTLALDFPRTARSIDMIQRMHEITLINGGRVYLAKDACLKAEHMPLMYPEVSRFKQVLEGIDPGGVMQSDMARRLSLCPEPGGAI